MANTLRRTQRSLSSNVSLCGETIFDLRRNSLGRRGKIVPYGQFYSLLRVAVRRDLEFPGTHPNSKLRRMEAKFWIWAYFLARVLDLFTVLQHPTYCANCSFLELLLLVCPFERLRLSQGSEP